MNCEAAYLHIHFCLKINDIDIHVDTLTGNAREERRALEVEGERRWERVVRATCLEDEATNLRSKPMAAEGSSAVTREESKR